MQHVQTGAQPLACAFDFLEFTIGVFEFLRFRYQFGIKDWLCSLRVSDVAKYFGLQSEVLQEPLARSGRMMLSVDRSRLQSQPEVCAKATYCDLAVSRAR